MPLQSKPRSPNNSISGARHASIATVSESGVDQPRTPMQKLVSQKLSDVTYLQSVKKKPSKIGTHGDNLSGGACAQMISLSEGKVSEMCHERREQLIAFNRKQLSRVYPKGTRFNSANMEDTDLCAAWEAGCHMIALNYQTWDGAMQLNRARFALNK